MKKKGLIYFSFYVETWGAKVWVLAGKSISELEEIWRWRVFEEEGPFEQPEAGFPEGAVFANTQFVGGAIGFRDRVPTERTVAHECFHMSWRILRCTGVKPCDETEEAYAYLLDEIVGRVTDGLKKRK